MIKIKSCLICFISQYQIELSGRILGIKLAWSVIPVYTKVVDSFNADQMFVCLLKGKYLELK